MAFLKFAADKLFNGREMLDGDRVVVTDTRGKIETVIPSNEAGEDVRRLSGIITPGFINCHCHLELSHMKGRIPEKTGLVDFVFSIVTERSAVSEDIIMENIYEAEQEMIKRGIVAVGDICNNPLTIRQKQKNNLHYYNFIEGSGFVAGNASQRIERARYLYEQFKYETPFEHSTSIVPHAPYSVSPELWQMMMPYYQDKVVSIHSQETAFEDRFINRGEGDFKRLYEKMNIDLSHYAGYGMNSVPWYYKRLEPASRCLLVHNTFLQQQDLDFIESSGSRKPYFCLCIKANQYIEDALPPVNLLRHNKADIVLGTDSLASNDSLSILDEINTIHHHFRDIPLREILGWATLNGAKALELESEFGSIEPNKKPGLNCISPGLDKVIKLM